MSIHKNGRKPDPRIVRAGFGTGTGLKRAVFALLLLLLPAWFPAAQQSFFIDPETEIRGGEIVRGYCLEGTQKTLTTANITNLTRVLGGATVTYKDGAKPALSFAELFRDNRPSITGFDTAEFIRMEFAPSIEKITAGNEGLILARTDADDDFIKNNAQTIMGARMAGATHAGAQDAAWRAEWKPVPVLDEKRGVMTVGNRERTGTPAGKEVVTSYGDDAGIGFQYPNGKRRDFDTVRTALTEGGTAFITQLPGGLIRQKRTCSG
jgi:hypothetical protein